jgi:3-oxoacyl-[acyl-carrier-protein] synthase III
MKAFIKAISYYLPEKVLTNEELLKEFPEWTVDKVASKIGVSERHICGNKDTASDLGYMAAKKLFAEYGIAAGEIDFVLYCTQSPDYFLPTTACILQDRLDIPTSAGALDFNLGCSGFIYGLSLAKGLVVAGIASNILLITSETYSKYIHPKDKGNRTIFGDGAAATLISRDGFASIENFILGTDGKGADKLILKTGAFRYKEKLNDLVFKDDIPVSSDHLFMDGMEIFNFTLERIPKLVEEILSVSKTEKDLIDLFIFHQANRYMLEFLRKKLKIEEAKFFYYLDKVGNTVSSTVPIALKEALLKGQAGKNSKVLIAGFGVGYSWGACLLQF